MLVFIIVSRPRACQGHVLDHPSSLHLPARRSRPSARTKTPPRGCGTHRRHASLGPDHPAWPRPPGRHPSPSSGSLGSPCALHTSQGRRLVAHPLIDRDPAFHGVDLMYGIPSAPPDHDERMLVRRPGTRPQGSLEDCASRRPLFKSRGEPCRRTTPRPRLQSEPEAHHLWPESAMRRLPTTVGSPCAISEG